MSLTCVVPCKGRLSFLRKSIPSFLSQQTDMPVVVLVVDYDCPDGTFEWCKSLQNPNLRCIRVLDSGEYFNVSRARNCGVRLANTPYIIAMDVDCVAYANIFTELIAPIVAERAIISGVINLKGQAGRSLAAFARKEWNLVRGYDERMQGWGFEDDDFFNRMAALGPAAEVSASKGLDIILHDDELRTRHYREKNQYQSDAGNRKWAACRKSVNPDGFGLCTWEE